MARIWLSVSDECHNRLDDMADRLKLKRHEVQRGIFEIGMLRLLSALEHNKDLDLQSAGLVAALRRNQSFHQPKNPML